MLTLPERILFAFAILLSLIATFRAFQRIVRILQRGHGRPDWNIIWQRILTTPARILTFQPVFRFRLLPSLFHALVGWGFLYFFLVNTGDLLQAYLPGFQFLGTGAIGNLYRLGSDIFSISVILGMIVLTYRRFILRPPTLTAR